MCVGELSSKTIPVHCLVGELSCSLIGRTYRPVYIESRVCVVKGVVKCSFEYLCVVRHDTRRRQST